MTQQFYLIFFLAFLFITSGFIFFAMLFDRLSEAELRVLREDDKFSETAADLLEKHFWIFAKLWTGEVFSFSLSTIFLYLMVIQEQREVKILSLFLLGSFYLFLGLAFRKFIAKQNASTLLNWLHYGKYLEFFVIPIAFPWYFLLKNKEHRFIENQDDPDFIEKTVEQLIEIGEESGNISEEQAELLLSVIEFRTTPVRDVMVPRAKIEALSVDMTIDDAMGIISEMEHSRYPLYKENIDQIEGVLYTKDLLREFSREHQNGEDIGKKKLGDLARRQILFTERTSLISAVLKKMQSRRLHLGIVIDEFGGTAGIVSLEDILEEIVGEIEDEHDDFEKSIRHVGHQRYIADATISLDDVEEEIGVSLVEEEVAFSSLGGLLVHLEGKVPHIGERFRINGFELRVLAGDEKRVERIEIKKVDS